MHSKCWSRSSQRRTIRCSDGSRGLHARMAASEIAAGGGIRREKWLEYPSNKTVLAICVALGLTHPFSKPRQAVQAQVQLGRVLLLATLIFRLIFRPVVCPRVHPAPSRRCSRPLLPIFLLLQLLVAAIDRFTFVCSTRFCWH